MSDKKQRVCVVVTSCTGKSTYLKHANNWLDMDEIIFPLLTEQEKQYVCQTPWTQERSKIMKKIIREKMLKGKRERKKWYI